MPPNRMNREEFFAKLAPLDAGQRGGGEIRAFRCRLGAVGNGAGRARLRPVRRTGSAAADPLGISVRLK